MLIRVITCDKSSCIVDRLTINRLIDCHEAAACHDSMGWGARHDEQGLPRFRPGRMGHGSDIALQTAMVI